MFGAGHEARVRSQMLRFAGDKGSASFLYGLEILVSVLPLTPATRVLNSDMFNQLAKGAFIINAGRGSQLVEDDLLDAIGRGQIAGAALDVFATEPLPPNHPFWAHPAITVWPMLQRKPTLIPPLQQVLPRLSDYGWA